MDREQTRASGAEVTFPSTIGIGELTLDIESITRKGRWIEAAREFRGVAGTAWLRFPCSRPVILPRWPRVPFEPWLPFDHRIGRGLAPAPAADRPALTQQLEVVARVVNAQTEIAFADAQRVR